MIGCELALRAEAGTGEGALWDEDRNELLWVDIPNGEIHRFKPADGTDRLILKAERSVGTVVRRSRGGLVAAMADGFHFVDENTGVTTPICDPEKDKPANRFNDGKCDPAGRLWAGTMEDAEWAKGAGSLYRLDADLSCTKMVEGVSISNGIAWSPDGRTMYYTDSPTGVIWAYDYDAATGAIANRKTAVEIAGGEGVPDGFTVDGEGTLWVAQWGGWQVGRYDPRTGRKIGRVDVPASQVASCALGGANLSELFITTARKRLTPEQLTREPLAGSLFVAGTDARGLPAFSFKG